MSFEPLRAGGVPAQGGFRLLQPTTGPSLPPVSSPFKPTPTCTPPTPSVTYVLNQSVTYVLNQKCYRCIDWALGDDD